MADVRDLNLPGGSIDAAFLNACYPDIIDKTGAFFNLSRMMKAEGRIVISHPLGKAFILSLKEGDPFPLDEFPKEPEVGALLKPFGFEIETFIDTYRTRALHFGSHEMKVQDGLNLFEKTH